jgi:hypothetical protein
MTVESAMCSNAVIASEAKQSRAARKNWIASSQGLLAMTAGMHPHSRDGIRPSFANSFRP